MDNWDYGIGHKVYCGLYEANGTIEMRRLIEDASGEYKQYYVVLKIGEGRHCEWIQGPFLSSGHKDIID